MPRSKAKLHLFVGRQMFSADNLLNNFEIEKEKEGRRGGGEGEREGSWRSKKYSSLHFCTFFLFPSFSNSCD